jgi:hypothetical protein
MLFGLGIGLALSGCAHDRRIRVTRWPRSEPLPGLFNIGGSTRGRSETPQGSLRSSRRQDPGISAPTQADGPSIGSIDGAGRADVARGAEADDEPAAVNTGREWSDAELHELGNMLVRGLSIEEIARSLRRDKIEVRDKIAEVGRACR